MNQCAVCGEELALYRLTLTVLDGTFLDTVELGWECLRIGLIALRPLLPNSTDQSIELN